MLITVLSLIEIALLYILLRPTIHGAIYFRTSTDAVDTMLRLSGAKPGEKIIDLGSGDGRILIAFAKAGCEAHGYEINPLLVWLSRRAIRRAGLKGKAFVHWKSFWSADLRDFDTVVVYCMPQFLEELGEKLLSELKPGARILSNSYSFPNWNIEKKENHVRLYVKS